MLLLPLLALLAVPAPAVEKAPEIAYEKYTLPNGLNVILHVDRKLPIVHVNQWFHVGSKNEKPGRTGFAHLFEHMMFQGSKNAPGEYFSYAEKAGANLFEGGVNGTTNSDRTNYFATVPSANLENVLWFESDRLNSLLDVLDKAKLDNQRDVVKNERRQSLENQPYGRWYSLLGENLYPAGHPYSWPVIGSHEDLTAASVDDVKEFFRRYYTPNNLSLVIAGDFDPAEAKRLVEKYFGSLPPGPALDRPARNIPALAGEKIVEVHDRVPQERTYFGWHSPAYFDAGDAELELAARVLADGLSSRLDKVLVYDKQLATGTAAFQDSSEIGSTFVVYVTARPGASLTEIEKIVTDEIARLAKTGPTPAELARAQTKQEFGIVSGLELIGGFGGKADVLNRYNTFLGDPGMFAKDLARYRNATTESVRKAVVTWLDTRNRVLLRFHPETSARSATPEPDRTQQPALGADKPFQAPQVKQAKLENGLEIMVVERPELPKVAVDLVLRAGAATDPAGKGGLAALTMRVLDKGTPTRSALAIEDALGDLGTGVDAASGRESAHVRFEVLRRNLDPTLAIVSDIVRNASFPAADFEREKKIHLDALGQQARNANALAARIRNIAAFGVDHPYGHPASGLPKTVEALTRADLVAFHHERFVPSNAALVFVGAVTLDEAVAAARQHFGAWSGATPAAVAIPSPKPMPAGRIYLVDRPDAAQAVITQFLPGPTRTAAGYQALELADAVWGGGGFTNRLNMNLREDKGYSYGVFSFPELMRESGVWWAQGGVQIDKTKESVAEFAKELKEIAGARPITAAEFEAAKVRKSRGYAQQFEGYSRVAGELADLWVLGLPPTELQREADETTKVTLEDALAAVKSHARPEAASLVVVADRAKVEAGLRELGLGEVVVLDAEGNPVR